MTAIYVDADACPVKAEVTRVAARHGVMVFMTCMARSREPGASASVITFTALDRV